MHLTRNKSARQNGQVGDVIAKLIAGHASASLHLSLCPNWGAAEATLQRTRRIQRDFFLGFLAVFSLCSLLLNGALLFHLSHPSFWRDFKLSWLHPPPVRATDHVRGDSNAPVTIVEYADFQCPYCKQMHASLQTAVQEGRIRWVYRHFPLSSIHPLAFKEAEAAECAGTQGKFWEYADALFAAQARLDSTRALDRELVSLAEGINVDPAALKECLNSAKFAEIVKSQIREAEALQISGTPTIFVDSKRHEGSVSYNDLKVLLANHAT